MTFVVNYKQRDLILTTNLFINSFIKIMHVSSFNDKEMHLLKLKTKKGYLKNRLATIEKEEGLQKMRFSFNFLLTHPLL